MHVYMPRVCTLVLFISPSAVTVHMEHVTYQVDEDEGSVEVCAVIQSPSGVECPVDFSVSVTISTSDDTACMYIIYIACLCMYTYAFV